VLPPLPPPQTFRERLGALRNLPPFLKLVWQTSPGIAAAQILLRLVRALIPVAALYVGAKIIDEVVRLTHAPSPGATFDEWLASGMLGPIALLLAIEFGLGVVSDLLGRGISLLDSLLSEKISTETSVRLMEHAARLDLEDFEDSEFQDRLERARAQPGGPSLFTQAPTRSCCRSNRQPPRACSWPSDKTGRRSSPNMARPSGSSVRQNGTATRA